MNSEPAVSTIGQIAIAVSDVAAAKSFYRDVLGLSEPFDAGPNLAFLAAEDVRIMLTTRQGGGEVGRNSMLYFRTTAIEVTQEKIIQRGARAKPKPQAVAKLADHEVWLALVGDADGNMVGLMEERR